MKKLFILLAFTFVTSVSFSQGLGFRGSIGVSNVIAEKDPILSTFENKIAYSFGVDYDAKILGFLHLNPAVLYSSKGFTSKYDGAIVKVENTHNFNYLEVPIDLVLKLRLGENFSISAFAGPYVSYLINTSYSNKNFEGNYDDYNKVDYGAQIGVGLYFNRFNIRAFYSFGLNDIYKEKGLLDYNKLKNEVLGITLGYSL